MDPVKSRAELLQKLSKLACKKFVLLRRMRLRHCWARIEALDVVLKG